MTDLPKKFDLRKECTYVPEILDQRGLPTCTSSAVSNALKFCLAKRGKKVWQPSRLYMDYYAKIIKDGPVEKTSGLSLLDVCTAILVAGVPSEIIWPYIPISFGREPTLYAKKQAQSHKLIDITNIARDLIAIKKALIKGFPVLYALHLYKAYTSKKILETGILDLPKKNEKYLYSHIVTIIGYDDIKKWFIVADSTGDLLCDKGYIYIPYDYVMNYQHTLQLSQITYFA